MDNYLLGLSLLANWFLLVGFLVACETNKNLSSELRIKNKKIARYRRREVERGYYAESEEQNRANHL